MVNNWYKKPVEEALSELNTSSDGLTGSSIKELQEKYGLNILTESGNRSIWVLFLSQFKSIMIIILFIAATISFLVGEHTDAYVIMLIILINAVLGFYQEYKAEESVKKLKQMAAPFAMVVRDAEPQMIDATQLVPGDIVLLEAGNIIPADGRLLHINAFKADEAVLTGESESVEKTTTPLEGENLLPADMRNMAFKGTIVSNGSAQMVVTATGMQTEIGKIALLLGDKNQKTPLQIRLAKFSRQLVVAVIAVCVIIFIIGLQKNEPVLSIFLTAVSLAVAALPEALPAVVTIALSRGAGAMARQNALVRQLPAVESLGSVTYICSDKTGTLTLNEMTVEKIWAEGEDNRLLLYNLLLNNDVKEKANGTFLGDSTEVALVKYALDNGPGFSEAKGEIQFTHALPFDSERMRMSTLYRYNGKYILLVKGAPLKIAEVLSPAYGGKKKENVLELNRNWASEGLRVLFFAYRIFDEKPAVIDVSLENDLQFSGMAGLIDPPRKEVIKAMRQCRTAGIKTVMITGDQPLTALSIAKRLGLADGEPNTLTGKELTLLSDEELEEKVKEVTVYARVSPEQKLRIVRALQQNGEFVAMTGDGVNDAPSLKQANIGVAMGITGSDVSKEAAQMILLDDNFTTIVKAVKEGRRIYENLKKFILYVLSCNLGEILVVLCAPVFGLPIPLLPIHILWINLITDGLPGVALAGDPASKDIMKHRPRPVNESFFSGGVAYRIITAGFIMGGGAILLQYYAQASGFSVQEQQTLVFSMLCFTQLGNAFLLRHLDKSIFAGKTARNTFLTGAVLFLIILQLLVINVPFLREVLKISYLNAEAYWVLFAAVFIVLAFMEVAKLLISKFIKPHP